MNIDLADNLAKDSEDDTKIHSAQARAAARKKKSGVKSVQKTKPYQANPAYMATGYLCYNNFCGPIRHNASYTNPINKIT